MGAISFLVKCGRRVSCNHLKVFPSSIKLRTCSYWIFHKKLFHCISFNPEPFTGVMSYLPTMSEWSQSSRAWCSRWAVWAQHAAHQHLSGINLSVFLNNSTEWLCVCLWVQLPAQTTSQNRLLSVFSASWLLEDHACDGGWQHQCFLTWFMHFNWKSTESAQSAF